MIEIGHLYQLADRGPRRIGIGGGRRLAFELNRRLRTSGHDIRVEAFSTPEALVRSMVDKQVDGAIRGVLSSSEVLTLIRGKLGVDEIMRTALMETPTGRPFMLTPVGIDEGRDVAARLELVRSTMTYFSDARWRLEVGVLSKGRLEDGGRSPEIKMSLREGERLTRALSRSGIQARHYAILLEDAIGESDVVVAPDGVTGNLIFRALHLVAGVKALGAPIVNIPMVFVDTSRAKVDYLDSVMLAAGLVGLKQSRSPHH